MTIKDFRVSKRYARALLSLARENGLEERTYEDMKRMDQLFSASKELCALLRSPVVREGKKQRILLSLLGSRLHPLNMGYVQIVIRKQRALLLPGIAKSFLQVYKEAMGIELVKVTTAGKMDVTLREKALAVAAGLTEKKIEFYEATDPGIIGGFILNLGDRQYDASIRSRLLAVRKHLNV